QRSCSEGRRAQRGCEAGRGYAVRRCRAGQTAGPGREAGAQGQGREERSEPDSNQGTSRGAMKRLAPAFLCAFLLSAQDFGEIKPQHLAKGYRFTEGPAWNVKDQSLVFSDPPSDRLFKWVPGADITVLRTDAHGPAGNAFDAL